MAMHPRPQLSEVDSEFKLSPDKKEIIVTNPNGIGFVGYEHPGAASKFIPIDQSKMPTEVRVPLALTKEVKGKGPIILRVYDSLGRSTNASILELTSTFIKSWQFAPAAQAWEKTDAFKSLADGELAKITASIKAQPVVESKSNFINMGDRYPDAGQAVGWAGRTIHVDKAQKLHIFTGSDDALRVWVNGKLVTEALKLREARPDAESAEISLDKGDNQVVVEVSQAGGNWGFFFRIEDANKKPMKLTADGKLVAAE
jgi:hypothetical protein